MEKQSDDRKNSKGEKFATETNALYGIMRKKPPPDKVMSPAFHEDCHQ
jgi:hypothetical protein